MLGKFQTAGPTKICLFVSLIYACFWHKAPLPERAPLNYFNLLTLLHKNPMPDIRDGWDAAVRSLCRHLWYFSEHLAPLALFDDRVDKKTKQAMVDNFSHPPNGLKQQDGKVFDHRIPLQEYVTSGSLMMLIFSPGMVKKKPKCFYQNILHSGTWTPSTSHLRPRSSSSRSSMTVLNEESLLFRTITPHLRRMKPRNNTCCDLSAATGSSF